jgi:uncharacterized protein YuzE
MTYSYDADHDALLVTFREDADYDDSEEIYPGFVIDFDSAGRPMGLDIYMNASSFFDIDALKLSSSSLPAVEHRMAKTQKR